MDADLLSQTPSGSPPPQPLVSPLSCYFIEGPLLLPRESSHGGSGELAVLFWRHQCPWSHCGRVEALGDPRSRSWLQQVPHLGEALPVMSARPPDPQLAASCL